MKGIILAGGKGSRLFPLTSALSKQLLPVYDKPLIFYPLSTLMLAGIREILIITTPNDQVLFKNLLGNGSSYGIEISYAIQREPGGLAQGIVLGKDFLNNDPFAFILGDNIFYGQGLGRELMKYQTIKGAHIFGYSVKNPSEYGVVEISENGNIISLEEKPFNPQSNIAITGLYFYDNRAVDYSLSLSPSIRGEIEITDLNNLYLRDKNLQCTILPRGTAWLDTGTFNGLHDAATFVRITEERTGLRIGDPSDVAKAQGWIIYES
jgi:glucose-1-phosphate thymidylyltransferase